MGSPGGTVVASRGLRSQAAQVQITALTQPVRLGPDKTPLRFPICEKFTAPIHRGVANINVDHIFMVLKMESGI